MAFIPLFRETTMVVDAMMRGLLGIGVKTYSNSDLVEDMMLTKLVNVVEVAKIIWKKWK